MKNGSLESLSKTMLRGLLVVLPIAILVAVLLWLYGLVARLVQPITSLILALLHLGQFFAEIISMVVTLLFVYLVGWVASTAIGGAALEIFETNWLRPIPGYRMLKEIALRLTGAKRFPFTQVALVQLQDQNHFVTGFVTDEHADGLVTVFVPTAPNPTSGMIYHIASKYVHPVDLPVEEAMQAIFSCGVGSGVMLERHFSHTEGRKDTEMRESVD